MKKVIIKSSKFDWNEDSKIYFENKKLLVEYEAEDLEVSDGYHTIDELYQHRYTLFCALCKIYDNYITPLNTRVKCWKSKLHADGSMFENTFIAGMTVKEFVGPSHHITYHMPIEWWDKFKVMEVKNAPEYDGHSPQDVLDRLSKL